MRRLHARNYATRLSGITLALVFAFLGFGLNTLETWFPDWKVKANEPAPVTVRLPARYFRITLLRSEFHYLSTTSSICSRSVPRGTRLKPGTECAGVVKAFETARRSRTDLHLLGIFSFYLVLGLILASVMRQRSMGRARLLRAQISVFLLLSLMLVSAKALFLLTALPSIVVPVLTVSMLTAFYFKRQFASAVVLISALATSSLISFDIEFFIIQTVAGLVAVTLFGKGSKKTSVQLKAGATAAWMALLCTAITTLIFSGTFNIHDDASEHLDPRYSLWISALIGGLGSGIAAYILTPITGWLVGEVSRSKLLDMQDLNETLLKRIQKRAPGTWEHSRAMANLAEAAVNAIGGNALLVRVGAYYHDLGKSNNPDFFIENQAGGPNPHDELSPAKSAQKIFRHVVDGTRMLRNEGFPEDIVEFCYSHHGTSILEYFWHKNMSEGNPDDLTERDFTYPGHRPSNRETGILMLVDAIEAGARTVDVPEKHAFENLVRSIVFSKLSQGQLDESGLSLGDLRTVINTLVDTLVNMYHARIKYPWQTGDTGSITASQLDTASEKPESDSETDLESARESNPPQKAAPEKKAPSLEIDVDIRPDPEDQLSESKEPQLPTVTPVRNTYPGQPANEKSTTDSVKTTQPKPPMAKPTVNSKN